jgi:L-serine dehydratase
MRAAASFRADAIAAGVVPARVEVTLLGSLSATGRGHGTDRAVLAGLRGWDPATCDVDALLGLASDDRPRDVPWGAGAVPISRKDVVFLPYRAWKDEAPLPHPNTLVCRAFGAGGETLLEQTWCSLGGGFVQRADGGGGDTPSSPPGPPRHPFSSADELVERARAAGLSIGEVVLENEAGWERRPGEVAEGLDRVWEAMKAAIARGLSSEGSLPGGLGVRRRAKELLGRVGAGRYEAGYLPILKAQALAYAVSEENAAGGRVVTAPTNGAAGVFPGLLAEIAERRQLSRAEIHRALATGGAFAALIKTHASLSGAEVGCQGEVGSATAMAAAALCEILGGDPDDVEYAAEIAMEHNLGLTCDPLKGLVQAPCIERNAMGVAKAWSAAQLALGTGDRHLISFDRVIQVMKRTGHDMRREYKETGEGGLALAVNLPEC